MVYEKNLQALKTRFPLLYKYIEEYNYDGVSHAYVELAKNGQDIVIYNASGKEYSLNSKYNPSREAEKYMEDVIDIPDEAVLTIIGLANGSFLREFVQKNGSHNTCVVYEPSVDIFAQVIKYIDISELLEDERVILVVKDINHKDFASAVSRLILV
ncbi:MAG: motility associated factor glycosyltransferase family protein, partial [Lachnospiraceae bacterium]|nr:motility associated factor glycosyltransferase family protein [Lachnospiraceae bacterium]